MKITGCLLGLGLALMLTQALPAKADDAAPVRVPRPDQPTDAAAVRHFIEAANATWMDAFRSGDTRAMAQVFAVNANFFPPSDVILEGRASILEYFAAQRGLGMRDPRLKTLEVVTMGEVAYEIGTYAVTFDDGESRKRSDSGRYFVIWRQQVAEGWRYQTGFWSSDARAGSPVTPPGFPQVVR